MKAVILAAGLGNRLGSFTKDLPKALVQAGGKELLGHVLDFLDHPAISEKIVVTGYKSGLIMEFLKKRCPSVITIHNPNFIAGSIRSIETALPLIDSDFILLNADHIYPKRMMRRILPTLNGITAVCDFDRDLGPDDMKVKLASDGSLKAIKKTLTDYTCGYIGLTYCPKETLANYKNAVALVRRSEGDRVAVESVLGSLAGDGFIIKICDASGFGWLEVDTPEDLGNAQTRLLNNPEFLS